VIDFVPSRVTSLGFAVVGSFEDAIDAWRNYSQRFPAGAAVATASRNDGLILAATSGAVNVRLGGEALKAMVTPFAVQEFEAGGLDAEEMTATPPTPGREPEVAHLRSVVGLVWRSVVLWMVLLALLTLARLLG
jgi:adenosylcobinamide-phosphate synthase